MQDVRAMRGMGRRLSDHQVYYVNLAIGAWIKRSEVENGARRIISEKLREHQRIEVYGKCP